VEESIAITFELGPGAPLPDRHNARGNKPHPMTYAI
jgi:hypothetical protein